MASDGPKLSADLFVEYKEYNKATSRVLGWLGVNLGAHEAHETWTLEQTRRAGRFIAANKIEVPDGIFIALKDTIERRTKLHQFFQRKGDPQDPKNRSHGMFIST